MAGFHQDGNDLLIANFFPCALLDDVTPPDGKDFALGAVALAVPALTVMPPPECA